LRIQRITPTGGFSFPTNKRRAARNISSNESRELLDDLLEDIKAGDAEALDYRIEELQPWQEWLMLHRFERRRVNRQLRQYAEGAPEWMNSRRGRQ
jgi:hypothetical protein